MVIVVYTPPATEPVTVAEVMAHCRIDTVNQEPAPGAPTVALGAGPGNVDNGAHRYVVTFVTADGETQAGTISNAVSVIDKTANGKVSISAIPIGSALVTGRKIYRTAAAGSVYYLLTTIADNTTTTYTDNTADSGLGVQAPISNTTSDPYLRMLITAARQHAENELRRYLITQTVDAYFDCFPATDKNGDVVFILPPLQSVTAVTYVDLDGVTQTLTADQYIVDAKSDRARVTPAYSVSWPCARDQANTIKIRFVAGYGTAADVPACIKHWMLMRIKQAYDQRDAVNVGNVVTEFPYSFVDGLLDPERVHGFIS